jgi:formylglycine-generating enzyme required for sulfatase activity
MGSSEEEVAAGIELCQEHYQPCNHWFYNREYPRHQVDLSPYWIDRFEISNQQYRLCVQAGICPPPLQCNKGEPTYLDPEMEDHPVVCVNWEEAETYCEWAGGRLPTEAEWEYAFRGDGSLSFPWGDEFSGSRLNFCDSNCGQGYADQGTDDGFPKTAPVGSFPEGISWAGVENLGGNVSEWVSDWYADYSAEAVKDPSGPGSGEERLIKGCSWYSPSAYCRGATRGSVDPGRRMDYLGFRCAGDPSPVIDGVIQPGEWEQAGLYYFEDGSELYLLYADNHLYLAIKAVSDQMISANVFLSSEDSIHIMHTSAALGTAIYQPEGDTWKKVRDFEWCCRSTMDSHTAEAEREDFLDQDGWLGINSFKGHKNELEYKIRLTGSEAYLAVNFLRVDQVDVKLVWPVGITDGPAQPTIAGFPDTLDFSPRNWFVLEVNE